MIGPEHLLCSTRQVWLGRLASLPLGLAACVALLLSAVASNYMVEPVPEPQPGIPPYGPCPGLPPRPPERPWPDIRELMRRPIPRRIWVPPESPVKPRPVRLSRLEVVPEHLAPDVARPVLRRYTEPAYPEVARRARLEGTVIAEAIIDAKGNVVDVHVLRPLALGCSEAALEAVRTWRYDPATRGGRPIPIYLTVVVTFSLKPPASPAR
jgi:protein TonB